MGSAKQPTAWSQKNTKHLKYVRGPVQSRSSRRRSTQRQQELKAAAQNTHSLLQMGFSAPAPTATTTENREPRAGLTPAAKAIEDLEQKLRAGIQKQTLVGQNLARHQAVLGFLKTQMSRKGGETREQMALYIARSHCRGLYFARKIIAWERSWLSSRHIEEGRKGCYAKTKSWLNDEGVQLAVREWLAGATEGELTGYRLARAVGKYLDSRRAQQALVECFGLEDNRIRARTARRWMKKMGFSYDEVKKGVYVDGHEREDVVRYC